MITIDLRAGLAKVHQGLDTLLPNIGSCQYSAPCAIGIMLEPDARVELDEIRELTGKVALGDWWDGENGPNTYSVLELFDSRVVEFTEPGHASLAADLQKAFDQGTPESFVETLDRITKQVGATS